MDPVSRPRRAEPSHPVPGSGFRVIASNPPGFDGAEIPIAASRAGEVGILDLTLCDDWSRAARHVDELTRAGRGDRGVRVSTRDGPPALDLVRGLPAELRWVLLDGCDRAALEAFAAEIGPRGTHLLVEVVSAAEADVARRVGAHGLVAKGHEAGGRVGEETSFVLLQRLLRDGGLPIWVRGGIGIHTAAACLAAGAAGVCLDTQLVLTREARGLGESVREAARRADGSESLCLGAELGEAYRLYHRPGRPLSGELAERASALAAETASHPNARGELLERWHREVRTAARGDDGAWHLGQDLAFAAPLAARHGTVGGVVQAIRDQAVHLAARAAELRPLAEGSPLARSHGTRYPIVQGPMTRVSDRAAFARAVADAGGLPFLALALLRAGAVRKLLAETRELLGERPWGVGILGFVPLELREEQLAEIGRCRPAFALIAGGRPDQAALLERQGVPTYLHVPSPALLSLFLAEGAHRFVFEGRECGGHVGPRTSFVLWNQMVDVLLETVPDSEAASCHVLFAGGIHDGRSAAMIAALAARLAERGMRVGVLMGTAYLFTREAVESGAIVEGFQREALSCGETVLLETGPGHATRCVRGPFAELFRREKERLRAAGSTPETLRESLERLNLGRLRVAAKGIDRAATPSADGPRYVRVDPERQRLEGLYMIGQVAALEQRVRPMEELHREVSAGSCAVLRASPDAHPAPRSPAPRPSNVAIIGIATLLPGAPDLRTFWHNVLSKHDAVTEIPPERFDWTRYFDDDRAARDKIYSHWGGFLPEIPFDPLSWGLPPASLGSIEPVQLLTLELVRAALGDAGYSDRPLPRQRTSVLLGAGGGVADLGNAYAVRSALPSLLAEVPEGVLDRLPEWTEDSFAGILLNVAAGRVANRFDFGGVNCTLDAACASSLAAVYMACQELETRSSDVVIAGGVDTVQNPFGYLCFSKTHALSPSGRCRTFDAKADGIAISEGLVALVLKRLEDAERDGDRIYALIQAVAGSSDGRAKGLTAPRPAGQALALRRAYDKAGFSAATVGLVEAHGTGTVAGDRAEAETLDRVFTEAGARRSSCALGSVKSMIGHTKCAAGAAGLAKVALALHHRVLPPTLHVERPCIGPGDGDGDGDGPLYLNSELRPWIEGDPDRPRRAGVSSFGFGGTNFHVALEEYRDDIPGLEREALTDTWPAELLLFRAPPDNLEAELARVAHALDRGARPTVAELARLLARRSARAPEGSRTLAIVATGLDELRPKLERARARVAADEPLAEPPEREDTFFSPLSSAPRAGAGRIAFLYPGQGSQYPGMLQELAVYFPVVREAFEAVDRALGEIWDRGGGRDRPLSAFAFPPPAFTPEERDRQKEALMRTDVAQPALGAAALGVHHLLERFGVVPDHVAGHSYGEYVALWAAGAIDSDLLPRLSFERGRAILDTARGGLGGMLAVSASGHEITPLLAGLDEVWVANRNAPRQQILSGTDRGLEEAAERLAEAGLTHRRLPVGCAFHSPLVAAARERLAAVLADARLGRPRLPVWANSTGGRYPEEVDGVRALLVDHLVEPVRFEDQIEAMYAAGARIFVEVGPRNVLARLVGQILADRDHLAIPTDPPGAGGLLGLLRLLGRLAAEGVAVDASELFRGRHLRRLTLEHLVEETRPAEHPASTWLVSGGGVRRAGEPATRPEPYRSTPVIPKPAPADDDGRRPLERLQSGGAEPSEHRAPAAASAHAGGEGERAAVVLRYQRFLHRAATAQEEVVAAYLTSGAAEAPARATLGWPDVAAEIELLDQIPPAETDDPARPLPRFLLDPRPAPEATGVRLPDGPCLVIDDGAGVAAAVAEGLGRRGVRVEVLRDQPNGSGEPGTADLADPGSVAEAVARLRQRNGPISCLVHLTCLGPRAADDPLAATTCAESVRTVRSLYLLARELQEDLESADGGVLLAATALGGAFGLDGAAAAPLDGAVAGLVKVLALEWPGVRCRALDLEPDGAPRERAAAVIDELGATDGEVEVARTARGRLVPRPSRAPLPEPAAETPLDASSVVLLTGGARGITALVAAELARRHRPTLVLAGRTPPPPEEERPETRGIDDMAALKRTLIDDMTRRGEAVHPAAVETAYRSLLAAREIRETLTTLRAAGARAEYLELDVRDPKAVTAALAAIHRRHGRLDGIIHGAGVIEDKLLRDKEPDSWDRVFGTKVDGALTLARAVDEHRGDSPLRFFLLFASVAGTFGNRGQCDYAAANEALCRLAASLDRRWQATRVAALAWGPWARLGMASSEVQRRFAERGVDLIAPEEGARAALDELARGRKGEPIVILGGGPWDRAQDGDRHPLLDGTAVAREAGGVELTRTLDPGRDLFLADHLLDGRPVLPAAAAMELMAETAALGWPGFTVTGLRDFRVQAGVVLDGGPARVRLLARPAARSEDGPVTDGALAVAVEIRALESGDRAAYRGVVELAPSALEPLAFEPPDWDLEPCRLDVPEIYQRYLFHGPLFASVRRVVGVGAQGLVAELRPSDPSACVTGAGGPWLIDPISVDGSFQLAILWSRLRHDLTPLPSRFARYRRLGPLDGETLLCYLEARSENGGRTLLTRHSFVTPDGRLVGLLEGMESTCSRELNRLASGPTTLRRAS